MLGEQDQVVLLLEGEESQELLQQLKKLTIKCGERRINQQDYRWACKKCKFYLICRVILYSNTFNDFCII